MKRLLHFFQTTLVGGVLFLVPIVVLIIVLNKALAIARKIVDPLAARLPFESLVGLQTPQILAIALLVIFCFVAGLFATTALAKRGVNWLESAVLSNVPGYQFLKSMGESLLGVDNEPAPEVVLARIEDAWQIAFLVERLEHGHVAVFVPGAPNPRSGSVYLMTEDRIKPAGIPPAAALKCLTRLGAGSSLLLGETPDLSMTHQDEVDGKADVR
jgi:uncharacterized membrane protein